MSRKTPAKLPGSSEYPNPDARHPPIAPAAPPTTARGRLPLDPYTGQPIGPLAQPGYYPGFSTLAQRAFWDEATRRVVLDRVEHVPPIRFFTADEARTLEAICARVIPQDDRDAAHRIPIVPRIDDRLSNGVSDGYRYEDMPPDGEAYRLGIAAIDAMARALYDGRRFLELAPPEQEALLRQLHDGKPEAAHEQWRRLPVQRFWLLLVGDCATAYYAHPYAWDEIGFGGPAYPIALDIPERPGVEGHDAEARAREPLRQHAARRARTDDRVVHRLVVRIAAHRRVEVLDRAEGVLAGLGAVKRAEERCLQCVPSCLGTPAANSPPSAAYWSDSDHGGATHS